MWAKKDKYLTGNIRRRNIRFVKKRIKKRKNRALALVKRKVIIRLHVESSYLRKKRTNPNSVILTYKIPPSG